MGQYFLGQYLSNRTAGAPRDTTRDKIWAALRYLIILGFVIAVVTLLDGTSPGGGFMAALGGALLASALVNFALVPREERKDGLNVLWAVAGLILLALGVAALR